jgi:NRAMP (natural resistance-associated macrophage protein)-like metal ion transporter
MEKIIQKVVESPAIAVDKAADFVKEIPQQLPMQKPIRVAKKYWGTLGPGLTTGASGDDPSGIASYSQMGARYGLQYLWLALYTIPPMIVVQEMCARIAQVTGRGLAGVIRQHYSKNVLYTTIFLLFVANTISIGADIAGMVAASQLLFPTIPYSALAIGFAVLSLYLQIGLPYAKYANFLKYLTLVLFAYVITAAFITLDWSKVAFYTLLPSVTFTSDHIVMVTAVLGATISPYLLFWQASQEIEQEKARTELTTITALSGTTTKQIKAMRGDVASGMIFSNLIMFFIIAVTGTLLFKEGASIRTAADAAKALQPLAGNYATLLFAVGVIGTGLLAIPILAGSSSYAFAEAFGLKQGLDRTLKQAYGFYGVIIIAVLVGLAINFVGIDPIQALVGAAIANGLITPILVTLILLVGNNKKIMGQWKNGPWSQTIGWLIAILMYIAGIATIWSLVS